MLGKRVDNLSKFLLPLDGSLVEIFEIVKEGFPKLILVTYKSLLREDVRPFLEGRVHRFGNCVTHGSICL